ncbi:MAG: hypothetical protein AABY22_36150 [Nanoarchaeota archaeon]
MEITRPEEYEKEYNDCAVRALSLAANIEYAKVHSAFQLAGRKDKHKVRCDKIISKVANLLGINIKLIKRSGSAAKLIKQYPKGRIFVLKSKHAFTIIDGVAHDLQGDLSRIKRAWLIQ